MMETDHESGFETSSRTERLRVTVQTLGERLTTAANAVTAYINTDDFRWRALVTTSRYTSHGMVIIVGVVAVLLAGFRAGHWIEQPQAAIAETTQKTSTKAAKGGIQGSVAQPAGRLLTIITANGTNPQSPLIPNQPLPIPQALQPIAYGNRNQDNGVLTRQIVLDTVKPVEIRQTIINYTVRAGDTIEAIAARFGLQPTTLIWSNKEVEDAPDILKIGQELNILPINGIVYTVEDGDTIATVAEKFKAKSEEIVATTLNPLQEKQDLSVGMQIVVPNGVKPFKARVVAASTNNNSYAYTAPAPAYAGATGSFMWPTAANYVSQGFWWGHRALDIAASVGVAIYASDSGCVSYAGWSDQGYGYMVMINHGNGFQSLYGHMSQYYFDTGQCISRGQVIGAMGSTGNSTGPHLHFEIRVNGVPDNPYYYLK